MSKALNSLWRITNSVYYYFVVVLSNGFTQGFYAGTVYTSENLESTSSKTVFCFKTQTSLCLPRIVYNISLADFALGYNDFEKLSLQYWELLIFLDPSHGFFCRHRVYLQ